MGEEQDRAAMVSDVRASTTLLRSELKAEIGALRSELKVEIGAVRSELTAEITAVRDELSKRISEDGETTRRHFDIMVEKVEAAVRIVAEVNAHHAVVLDNHEARLKSIER